MHFLCLHGGGANNQIFEVQTAALRYELGDDHSFEFAEGAVACPPAPEIQAAFKAHEECFAYYDPSSAFSRRTALSHLDAYIAAEGPFDAVLAFSQGAALAAAYISDRWRQDSAQKLIAPVFKCAVFLSGGSPNDPAALARGDIRLLKHDTDGVVIGVPVTNIWGKLDSDWGDQSKDLNELCEPKSRTVFVHDGGHEVPGTGPMVTQAVRAIKRTIDRALFAQ